VEVIEKSRKVVLTPSEAAAAAFESVRKHNNSKVPDRPSALREATRIKPRSPSPPATATSSAKGQATVKGKGQGKHGKSKGGGKGRGKGKKGKRN
jgi:hypothetical protein